jgi:MFS family permease
VWVDRLRRRPVLIAGDLGRVVALGSIPLAYKLHLLHMPQLYLVAFVSGICTVFFDVAYQAYLPSLVERDQLVEGNGKLEISRSGAQLAGPGLAGALIQILRAPVAIAADAISYLGSAIFVGWIRKPEPPVEPHVAEDGSRVKMRTQIREGLRYVTRHKLLLPIAGCTASSNLFGSMTMAILVLFAVRDLGLSPGKIGAIFAVGNAGFLAGAFLPGRFARLLGVGWAIIASIAFGSVSALLIPFATRANAVPFLVASLAGLGFGSVIYNVNQVSLRQSITPIRMQGRMNATMRFMVWGTMPIGSFVGGILGNTIGLRPTLWVAAIGGQVSVLFPLLSQVRKLREIPAAEPPPPVPDEEPAAAIVADGRVPVPSPDADGWAENLARGEDGTVEPPAHVPHASSQVE